MNDFAQKDEDLGGTLALDGGDVRPPSNNEPPAAPRFDVPDDLPEAEVGLPAPADTDAGFDDVVAAGWQAETIRTDAWDYAAGKRREVADQMFDLLPKDVKSRVWSRFADNTTGWTTFEEIVMEEAATIAKMTPETAKLFAGFPLTKEGMDSRINDERRAELEAAERILDQDGGAVAEFLGTSARAMTDQVSLLTLPLGGGSGAAWKMIAREALAGAVGEALILPRETEVSEELGIERPDAVSRIGMGAVLGGGLTAGLLGIGKAVSLFRGHRDGIRAAAREGDELEAEIQIDEAEARLRGDETVQQKVGPKARPSDPAPDPEPGTMGGILGRTRSHRAPDAVNVVVSTEGKIRDKPVSEDFMGRLRGAVAPLGDDIGVVIVSGGQDTAGTPGGKRTGSTRHDVDHTGHSHTGDVVLTRNGVPVRPGEDKELYARFFFEAAKVFPGIGHYEWGVHVGGGSVMSWGPDTKARSLDPYFGKAIEAGRAGITDFVPGAAYRAAPSTGTRRSAPLTEEEEVSLLIGAESSGRSDAVNPNSSATGHGQFLDGTWLEVVRTHRPDLLEGRTPAEVLELRRDPAISRELTRAYMRDNTAAMKAAGIETVGAGERYLAHFLGPTGAIRVLKAAPETPVTQLMSPKQIADNKGVRFGGKRLDQFTAHDLHLWARSKMDPNRGGYVAGSEDIGPTSRGYTGSGQVAAGDEFRIDVDYEIVDADSLFRASGDFQPRDRSRIASDAWIADTAARLDPAQLMPSPTADRGPPVVGPDGMIESGNGRYGAILRAYEKHPDRAAQYRAQIEAAGFAVPEGVQRPVLVARRKSELSREDRVRFTVAAQDSGVAVMTPTEVARTSSRAMTPEVLGRLDPAQPIRAEGNADFVRSALAALPRSARNAMFEASGMLNSLGERQLREALFARAWPDPDILARYTEGNAAELKSLLEALETAAPGWAALRADIEAGRVSPDMDIGGHVLDAMRLIAAARELAASQKLPIAKAIAELLDEVDMIEGAISPLTAALVRKFWKNGRAASADEVGTFLTRYADEARKAGATGGMFDAPGPRDVLITIDRAAFGDLPQDFGAARGYATPAAREPAPLPDQGFDQGAASVEAEAADAAMRADLEADGPFGPVLSGFENDWRGAVDALVARQSGEAPGALHHAEAGPISLVWGHEGTGRGDGAGLAKILKYHPEVLDDLQGRLDRADKVISRSENRIRLASDTDNVVIRLDHDGAQKTWLLTAYEREADGGAQRSANRITGRADELPEGSSPSAPLQKEDSVDPPSDQEPATEVDAVAAEMQRLRDEFSDLSIEIDDITYTARDMLDDLDADNAATAIIQSCGIIPTGGVQ